MSVPAFVPLTCPHCGGELLGRASDFVAFCVPCKAALRVDGETTRPLASLVVRASAGAGGTPFALPFWASGAVAIPAFHTARPLTLARMASGLLSRWPAERGLVLPPPLGARLLPEALPDLARLARLEPPDPGSVVALIGVPAMLRERRVLLPGLDGTLYPDDVSEEGALVRAAGSFAEPART